MTERAISAEQRASAAEARADRLERLNRQMVEALRFYADRRNWHQDIAPDPAGTPVPGTSRIDADYGSIALAALQQEGKADV